MSWWRHCSAVVPGPAQAVLSFQAVSGLGDTLKMALKEASSVWGSAKADANRYSWGFHLYSCVPTSARRGSNSAVKASKASRILADGLRSARSSELTPSHACCVLLTPEIPLGTEGWPHRDAERGGCHQPPLFLQSPSSLGRFWDETSPDLPASRRAASLHERERLQGFLFQSCCFGFSLLF